MLKINVSDADKLLEAMKGFQGNVEETINDILHNEADGLIQDAIRRLIPRSGAKWKGKKNAAADGASLRGVPSNLAITVTTTKNYQYLYFPDDGTNTRRHVGNQRFFERGGEAVEGEIVERCIGKLTNKFEQGV